jgi:hypothetical protein
VQRPFPVKRLDIPYIYKITVLLKPGINHICWCTESTALSLQPGGRLGNARLLPPRSGFGIMQTYELQENESRNYETAYKKIEPLAIDPIRPKAYTLTPNSPPKFITILSSPGKCLPSGYGPSSAEAGKDFWNSKP